MSKQGKFVDEKWNQVIKKEKKRDKSKERKKNDDAKKSFIY